MDIEKLKDELIRLVEIMETLRGPDGCPWDRKQDYFSLQSYIIEEAYEVVEALQLEDLGLLKDELGDLLLQVIFEAQIAREKGDFDLIDVFEAISSKLIRRHPHVFINKESKTLSEQRVIWEDIKKEEQNGEDSGSVLDNIVRGQPALNQAYEIQTKAAKVGFDWDRVGDVVDKIEEELAEVKEAMKECNREEVGNELGDLLFAVVNLIRFYDFNPEVVLLRTILKFKERFKYIERRVEEEGYELQDLTLVELDSYWEESKQN